MLVTKASLMFCFSINADDTLDAACIFGGSFQSEEGKRFWHGPPRRCISYLPRTRHWYVRVFPLFSAPPSLRMPIAINGYLFNDQIQPALERFCLEQINVGFRRGWNYWQNPPDCVPRQRRRIQSEALKVVWGAARNAKPLCSSEQRVFWKHVFQSLINIRNGERKKWRSWNFRLVQLFKV